MAMPSLQEIKAPAIQCFSDRKERSVAEASEALATVFKLSENEKKETIGKGAQLKWRNRINWALFELSKAGLVDRPKQGIYRISETGLQVAGENPAVIDSKYLKKFPQWNEYLRTTKSGGSDPQPDPTPSGTRVDEKPPEERISSAYDQLVATLKKELLEQAKRMDPFRFEQLVIDLLVAMGYGGSKRESAKVTKMSNDEGIDGIINDDTLGLDVIYVQAKRWQNAVGRKEIQSFVGALAGQKAHKGVFITTSAFHDTATAYVKNIQQKVILIDGNRLAELMIQHNIGVANAESYHIKRLDTDYFTQA